jgi:ribose transport system substrate-binding protein
MARKLYILAAAAAILALSPGCRRDGKKIIGVIAQGRSHLFWQSIHAGAVAAAREKGVEISWNAPLSETDFAGELQIMNAMINRHLDAIAVSPIDRKALVSVVERATAEKIPVIIFDTGVETDKFVARVATDNYAAGRMAAERIGAILNGKGTVLMVACQPGATSTIAREQGFEDVLREKFAGIKIGDKRFGMSDFAKSLAVAENMLTAHPDADAIFASNETGSVGAAQALKGRQGKTKLVGFDWSPTLIEDLKSGGIDSLVVQDPFRIGYESVMAAVEKLNGGTPQKEQSLTARLITKDDLSKPDVQKQLNPDLKKYLD